MSDVPQYIADDLSPLVPDPCGANAVRANWQNTWNNFKKLNRGNNLFDEFGNLVMPPRKKIIAETVEGTNAFFTNLSLSSGVIYYGGTVINLANLARGYYGIASVNLATGAKGTVRIWSGVQGAETDSGVDVQAQNYFRNVMAGQRVWMQTNPDGYYIVESYPIPPLRFTLGGTTVSGTPPQSSAISVLSIEGGTPALATLSGGQLTITQTGKYLLTYSGVEVQWSSGSGTPFSIPAGLAYRFNTSSVYAQSGVSVTDLAKWWELSASQAVEMGAGTVLDLTAFIAAGKPGSLDPGIVISVGGGFGTITPLL